MDTATYSTMLDNALALAARGFHCFPVRAGAKAPPLIDDFPSTASRDPEQIRQWWAQWPAANVAISTSRFGDGEALLAVDIDVKPGKEGRESYEALDAANRFPKTYTQRTPTGGAHLVYRVPVAVKQSVEKLGPGLDIRSKGGYVVAAGSVIDGAAYTGEGEVAPAPEWLVERCGVPKTKKTKTDKAPGVVVDQDAATKRAREYLEKDAPLAIEGQGGDAATYAVACRVRDFGVIEPDCVKLMWMSWNDRCSPSWTLDDLRAKVGNAYSYAADVPGNAAPESVFAPIPDAEPLVGIDESFTLTNYSDVGNANLLRMLTRGNLRYVKERDEWIWWNGKRWTCDTKGGHARSEARKVGKQYLKDADKKRATKATAGTDKIKGLIDKEAGAIETWARSCWSTKAIGAMLKELSSDPDVSISIDRLDRDPLLLGVQNGVVDLRTGKLRDAGRDDFVTKRCSVAYDVDAKATLWLRVFDEITGTPAPIEYDPERNIRPESVKKFTSRPDIASFLQRVAGYLATGLVVEQKMIFCHGKPGAGKNLMADVLQHVLGDYARAIAVEALMTSAHQSDGDRATPTAAFLPGVRAAFCSETQRNHRWDSNTIKNHTGNKKMSARQPHGQKFEFDITHKLVGIGNHSPAFDHDETAMHGRLHMVELLRRWNRPDTAVHDPELPNGDKTLLARLIKEEAEGILAWIVRGAVSYLNEGLKLPKEVEQSTQAYIAAQGQVAKWLPQWTRCAAKNGTKAGALLADYQRATGDKTMTKNAFAVELAMLRVEKAELRDGKYWGLTRVDIFA